MWLRVLSSTPTASRSVFATYQWVALLTDDEELMRRLAEEAEEERQRHARPPSSSSSDDTDSDATVAYADGDNNNALMGEAHYFNALLERDDDPSYETWVQYYGIRRCG